MTVVTNAMDYRDLRVFVSSRMAELAEERRAIKAAFQDAGFNAWVFEEPDGAGAQPRSVQRTYLDELDQADLYVGIFWRGYGEYTEDEYRHAVSVKPCLVYEKRVDIEDRDARLQALLDEMSAVTEGLTIQRFTTADELARFASRDVRRLLTRIFRDRSAAAVALMQVPPPRGVFVPRPVVTKAIKSALLAPALAAGALRTVAIVGMGGSGKSMLAAAVARDPEVRAAFPDGALWTMLGRAPDTGAVLEGWIRALGNQAFRFTTQDVARAELTSLVSQRRVLIVIDDASDPAHVEPLLVGSGTSAVLITTREHVVAQAAGALGDRMIEVRGVTEDEALIILGGGPGHALQPSDAAVAAQIAVAVGYLPLALSLAAMQAADGVTWAELVADLTAEINRLEGLEVAGAAQVVDPEVRKRLSLRASLNVSLHGLTLEQRERFEALGVLRKGTVITAAVAGTVWSMEPRVARDELRYLRGKALLLAGGAVGRGMTMAYTLHDVVRDFAWQLFVERNGGQPANAHAKFVDRVRARLTDGQWHTAPNDGYTREHLVFHLERADRADFVHVLLAERSGDGSNAWLGVRSGDVDGYLDDVRRALRLALAGRGGETTAIGLPEQLFYLLILATHVSFSPPPVLARELVLKDRLGLSAARAYGLATHDLARQVRTLTLLSETTTGSARDGLLDDALAAVVASDDVDDETRAFLAVKLAAAGRSGEALALAADIKANSDRAIAFGEMMAHLSPTDREAAVERGFDSAKSSWVIFAPAAVAAIASHVDETRVRQLIDTAQTRSTGAWRDEALEVLAPRLLDFGHLDEAQSLVRSFASAKNRAAALVTMLPKLTEPQRSIARRAALDAVRDIDDNAWRESLSEASNDIIEEAAARALMDLTIEMQSWRSETLARLTPHLPAEMLGEALAIVETATDSLFRVTGVAAIMSELEEATRRKAASAALESVWAIESPEVRAEALLALLQHSDADEASNLTTRLLDTIEAIDFGYQRSQRLAKAAPAISPDSFGRALDIVESLSANDRAAPVEALAPRLDAAALDRAFLLCRVIQDGDAVRKARIAALIRLNDDDRLAAMSIAKAIENPYQQAAAIARLAAVLPEHALPGALESVRALRDREGNSVVDVLLPALARRASGDERKAFIQELVTEIAAKSDGEEAAWKVDETADLLSSRDYEDILAAAPAIAARCSDDLQLFERLVLEVELLRGLPEPARSTTLDDVLTGVPKLEENYHQRNMLVAAARHAPELAFPRVVDLAVGISDPVMRAMTLALLMRYASDAQRIIVERIGEIAELSGPLGAAHRSLAEMTFAHMLAHISVDEPLDIIAGFEEERARSIALVGVAPRLHAGDLERSLEITRGIDDRVERCTTLLALADVFPENKEALVDEALAGVITFDPDRIHGEMLASVAKRLVDRPPALLTKPWTATVRQLADCPRPALVGQLEHLVPMVERGGGDTMLRSLTAALGDVARWFP